MFIHELLVRLSEHKHSNGADPDDIRIDNVIWSATLRAHIYKARVFLFFVLPIFFATSFCLF